MTRAQDVTDGSFHVYLTLGNEPPGISWVNGSVSANPVINGQRTINIQFNVTDPNGVDDLNDATASIYLNKTGETQRFDSSCVAQGNSGTTETYVCTINMEYYDIDGPWTINASIEDNSGQYAQNLTYTFSYGSLKAIALGASQMNFSSVSVGQQNVGADQNPLHIDNQGNQDVTYMNLTAYSLLKGAEFINASAFTVNVSDGTGVGDQLQNGTAVVIQNSNLVRDSAGTDNNETLYLYVDVPSSGLTSGTFNASNAWELNVN